MSKYFYSIFTIIGKAYKFIVCEFGGFQNVLRDACVRAIPT